MAQKAQKDIIKKTVVQGNKDKYGVNPFLSNFTIKVNKVERFGTWQKVKVEGEDDLILTPWNWVDSRPHSNLYHIPKHETEKIDGVEVNINEKINHLAPNASKLYSWIQRNLSFNDDVIVIKPQRYMKECDIKSIKTFRAAIKLVIKAGFIAKVDGQIWRYWINPKYIFMGNAVTQLKDNLVYPSGTPEHDKIK